MGSSGSKNAQIKTLEKLGNEDVPDLVKDRAVVAKVTQCYDGDTCTIVFLLNKSPVKLHLRLADIDTAELPRRKDESDRTPEEIELSKAAREFLSARVLNKCVYVDMQRWDKWGGRVLGYLYCVDKQGNPVGESLGKQLLDAGLAVPYLGDKKSTDWSKVYAEWKAK